MNKKNIRHQIGHQVKSISFQVDFVMLHVKRKLHLRRKVFHYRLTECILPTPISADYTEALQLMYLIRKHTTRHQMNVASFYIAISYSWADTCSYMYIYDKRNLHIIFIKLYYYILENLTI